MKKTPAAALEKQVNHVAVNEENIARIKRGISLE